MAERKVVHRTLSVRVPEDIHAVLAGVARQEDRSLNAQIVRCLRECAARYQAAPPAPPVQE